MCVCVCVYVCVCVCVLEVIKFLRLHLPHMFITNSWQFFGIQIIPLELNISCENMSGYLCHCYFYITHGIIKLRI
jgi:hypothetical protein